MCRTYSSTMHEKGVEPNENQNVPDIIQFYWHTKGDVDTLDQLSTMHEKGDESKENVKMLDIIQFYN